MIVRIGTVFVAIATLMVAVVAHAEPKRPGSANIQNSPHFRMPHPNSRHDISDFRGSYQDWQSQRFYWKVGNRLPEEYRYSEFFVDYRQHHKLNAPTRFQQWVKVNDHYLLINIMTNTILQVIHE